MSECDPLFVRMQKVFARPGIAETTLSWKATLRKLGNIDQIFCPAFALQQTIKFGAGFLLYTSTGNVDGTCIKFVIQLQYTICHENFHGFSTPTVVD